MKPVTFHKGEKHNFLGMELDFSDNGICHVRQEGHIDEMIDEWPEKFENCAKVLTPASNSLYELGGGGLLSDEKAKIFHRVVAKGLFVSCRSRPDITPTISVLSGRVRTPNKNDWEKGRRLIRYLKNTRDLHLILQYDGLAICRWYVDAAFAVHPDMKSHTGITFTLGKGAIISGSTK